MLLFRTLVCLFKYVRLARIKFSVDAFYYPITNACAHHTLKRWYEYVCAVMPSGTVANPVKNCVHVLVSANIVCLKP